MLSWTKLFRRGFPLAVVAAAALFLAAPAAAGSEGDARLAVRAVKRAVAAGRIPASEGARYRLIVRKSRRAIGLLPGARRSNLAAVLRGVAVNASSAPLGRGRALTLFSMLEFNTRYLGANAVPPNGTDVADSEGVVYRTVWGRGLQFHPLANFGRLNSDLSARRDVEAGRLAVALAGRAVSRGRGVVWEYYFPFGGGAPPWTSGMAQAVAAQALARAGERFADPLLVRTARRGFRAIPSRLAFAFPSGPWVRLYSFSSLVVLNAQLQALLSVREYAAIADDTDAAVFGERLRKSTIALLPKFDTGYWSRYSLGNESPLSYHEYVVSLLKKLGWSTRDAFWTQTAERFERYTVEPPLFKVPKALPAIYPVPADGFRDETKFTFWLSKVSSVRFRVGGETFSYYMRGGWHTLYWRPGSRRPGRYGAWLAAVDLAGNRGTAALPAIEIRRDTTPPTVEAKLVGRRLSWKAVDNETPWVRLRVRLVRGERIKHVELGQQKHAGQLRLELPRLKWEATLVVFDSSRNRTRVPLGTFGGRT